MEKVTTTISPSKFFDILNIAINWVEKRTVSEALSGFLINCENNMLSVSATDGMSTSIVLFMEVESDGEFTVLLPAHDLLSKMKVFSKTAGDIIISFKKIVVIKSDKHRVSMSPMSYEYFPEIDTLNVNAWSSRVFSSVDFGKAVDLLRNVYTIDGPRPVFNGIFFSGEDAVAIDGFRMAVYSGFTFAEKDLLVSGVNCQRIARAIDGADYVTASLAKDEITGRDKLVIEWDDNAIETTILDYDYPQYKVMLPKNVDTKFAVSKKELSIALGLASGYAAESQGLVIFSVGPEKLHVESISTIGSQESEMDYMLPIEGPQKRFGLSIKYISDALSKLDDEIVFNLRGEGDMVILGNIGSYVYGIMPMHIKES